MRHNSGISVTSSMENGTMNRGTGIVGGALLSSSTRLFDQKEPFVEISYKQQQQQTMFDSQQDFLHTLNTMQDELNMRRYLSNNKALPTTQ